MTQGYPGLQMEAQREPLGPHQCLRTLETLSIAFECMLVRGPYCDDPLRTYNLQLQVRIVGHGHELRVSWPPEDGMVRSQEPHHFEGEDFSVKVLLFPEHDGQVNLPNGESLHSRNDPVEWCARRPQLGPRDAHVVKH
jgi:hypothetical protein